MKRNPFGRWIVGVVAAALSALALAQTPPDRSIALSYPEQTRLRAQFLARQFAPK